MDENPYKSPETANEGRIAPSKQLRRPWWLIPAVACTPALLLMAIAIYVSLWYLTDAPANDRAFYVVRGGIYGCAFLVLAGIIFAVACRVQTWIGI
jgi:hypothetical protein